MCRGNGFFREQGSQLTSRSVLNDFIDDALNTLACSLFKKWNSLNTESVLVTFLLVDEIVKFAGNY